MRRVILCAALLAATPAMAQRVDTRVDDVTETGDGFSCRSHAYPELRFSHDWRDGDRAASWEMPARETTAGDLRLRASFRPDVDAEFGAAATVLGFQLDLRTPLRADPKAAHLRIDGKPDATMLEVEGTRDSVTVAVLERLRGDLAARLESASIVEIDLTDGSATPIGRYSWDVRSFRRLAELLQIINWSCR